MSASVALSRGKSCGPAYYIFVDVLKQCFQVVNWHEVSVTRPGYPYSAATQFGGVTYITAKVADNPVNISEASIRSDLLFDDADGIDSLHNQAIFDAIQLMGYEGDLTILTFNKALFSPYVTPRQGGITR
ncbi:hypothetical protein Tco_1160608 [Tanacetum coccineum]